MTWHDALKNCRELDGNGFDLVAPSSMDEILWIHSHPALTVVGEYWTGGNDLDVEGTFVWSNGEPWIYQDKLPPWDDGEPLGDGENCVQSYAKVADEGAISIKVLNDLPCNRLNAVICEWTPPASE